MPEQGRVVEVRYLCAWREIGSIYQTIYLVKNEIPYLGPEGRTRRATPAQTAACAQATWGILQRKWRAIPGGLEMILDEAHPLGFLRELMLELYGIELPARP